MFLKSSFVLLDARMGIEGALLFLMICNRVITQIN